MSGAAPHPAPAGARPASPPVRLGRRSAMSNLVAQGSALGIVSLASLIIARIGGAAVLGEYTLLRVLPWLVGVVTSCGLPIASSYFLGARGDDRALRPTLAALAGLSALVTVGVWAALTPVLHGLLFEHVPFTLVVVIGFTGITQLWTVWAKACCQGTADLRGANLIIVGEELMFLPAYGIALGLGLGGIHAVVAGTGRRRDRRHRASPPLACRHRASTGTGTAPRCRSPAACSSYGARGSSATCCGW